MERMELPSPAQSNEHLRVLQFVLSTRRRLFCTSFSLVLSSGKTHTVVKGQPSAPVYIQLWILLCFIYLPTVYNTYEHNYHKFQYCTPNDSPSIMRFEFKTHGTGRAKSYTDCTSTVLQFCVTTNRHFGELPEKDSTATCVSLPYSTYSKISPLDESHVLPTARKLLEETISSRSRPAIYGQHTILSGVGSLSP
jgi:hypothetical protein